MENLDGARWNTHQLSHTLPLRKVWLRHSNPEPDPTGTVWLTFPAFQILLFLFFQLEVQPQIYNVVYKVPWLFFSKGVVTCNDILEMVLDFQGVYFGSVRCSFINAAEWYLLDASRIPKFKMFQMCLDFNFEELLQVGVSPNRSFQSQIGFYASCWLWLYIFTVCWLWLSVTFWNFRGGGWRWCWEYDTTGTSSSALVLLEWYY